MTESQTILTDSFTRADSAASLGTTDTGQAWTAHSGTWGISSNKGYCATQSGDSVASFDAGFSDLDLRCAVTMGAATSQPGIVYRTLDASNYWLLMLNDGGGDSVDLWKRVGGGYTNLVTATCPLTYGQTYDLRVLAVGSSHSVWVDGSFITTQIDSDLSTETRVGLRIFDTSAVRWDNLRVTPR